MVKTERQKLGLSSKETGVEQKSLRELLKAKQGEIQKVQTELSGLREQMNTLKAQMEEYVRIIIFFSFIYLLSQIV